MNQESRTAHVHVVTTYTHSDGHRCQESACYPWPGYTMVEICRDPRFRACSRGRTKITVRDLGEGCRERCETTVLPGGACTAPFPGLSGRPFAGA